MQKGYLRSLTTVAYSKGILAADTLLTPDMGYVTKLGRNPNGDIAGITGTVAIVQRWLRAFVRGDDELPSLKALSGEKNDDSAVLIIRKATRNVELWEVDGCIEWDAPFYTTGSGWQFAMGALAAGASAKKAVEIACKYDPHTGGPVETLKL